MARFLRKMVRFVRKMVRFVREMVRFSIARCKSKVPPKTSVKLRSCLESGQ